MKRFNHILCVVTAGEEDQPALDRAVMLAENNRASLTVIDVVEPVTVGNGAQQGVPTAAELQGAMMTLHEEALELLISPYRERLKVQSKVLSGIPFLEMIREVLRNGHDLLIKTAETPEWQDHLFGSDDMHLLRKCPSPVWLIKPQLRNAYQRVLVAVDVEDACSSDERRSRQAMNCQLIEMARSLALADAAELHVVHVWDAPGERIMRGASMQMSENTIAAYIEEERRHHAASLDLLVSEVSALASDGLTPQIHLIRGRARREIPALARQIGADLVVMGTVARTGIPGFIVGNTAEAILNQLDCSVLAIKPQGFISPVTLEE
ncbi:MAG TPA: universal stress protein, UspA [Chromatiales bacterium]|nr:universal stress protein, UspA [Chromatiales bacterium]